LFGVDNNSHGCHTLRILRHQLLHRHWPLDGKRLVKRVVSGLPGATRNDKSRISRACTEKTLNPETSGPLGEFDTPIGQTAEIAALAWRVPDPAHLRLPLVQTSVT
jgi:hypothetical protein